MCQRALLNTTPMQWFLVWYSIRMFYKENAANSYQFWSCRTATGVVFMVGNGWCGMGLGKRRINLARCPPL